MVAVVVVVVVAAVEIAVPAAIEAAIVIVYTHTLTFNWPIFSARTLG